MIEETGDLNLRQSHDKTCDNLATGLVKLAQGCLLGQLAGDALGSLVEFRAPQDIRREYPNGIRELADGGTWNTIAGQPTDDSELSCKGWTVTTVLEM
jgi:hypothetical protein